MLKIKRHGDNTPLTKEEKRLLTKSYINYYHKNHGQEKGASEHIAKVNAKVNDLLESRSVSPAAGTGDLKDHTPAKQSVATTEQTNKNVPHTKNSQAPKRILISVKKMTNEDLNNTIQRTNNILLDPKLTPEDKTYFKTVLDKLLEEFDRRKASSSQAKKVQHHVRNVVYDEQKVREDVNVGGESANKDIYNSTLSGE